MSVPLPYGFSHSALFSAYSVCKAIGLEPLPLARALNAPVEGVELAGFPGKPDPTPLFTEPDTWAAGPGNPESISSPPFSMER